MVLLTPGIAAANLVSILQIKFLVIGVSMTLFFLGDDYEQMFEFTGLLYSIFSLYI